MLYRNCGFFVFFKILELYPFFYDAWTWPGPRKKKKKNTDVFNFDRI